MELAFVGGILFVALLGFIAYKVKESKDKKAASGGGAKGTGRNTKVN